MPETTTPPIRSIRARAKKIVKAAGIEYATSYPSRIQGMRNWSPGITIDEVFCGGGGLARITSHYSIGSRHHLATAIKALRDAGWTVEDDGRIMAVAL